MATLPTTRFLGKEITLRVCACSSPCPRAVLTTAAAPAQDKASFQTPCTKDLCLLTKVWRRTRTKASAAVKAYLLFLQFSEQRKWEEGCSMLKPTAYFLGFQLRPELAASTQGTEVSYCAPTQCTDPFLQKTLPGFYQGLARFNCNY